MFFGLFSRNTKVIPEDEEEEEANANGKRVRKLNSSDHSTQITPSRKQAKFSNNIPRESVKPLSFSLHSQTIKQQTFGNKERQGVKETSLFRIATEKLKKISKIDEILSVYANFLGRNPEPVDFDSALSHAYSCLIVEIIGNICRCTPYAHADFGLLTQIIRSFHKLSPLISLHRQIYTVQIPKITEILSSTIDSEKLLFSIFDWSRITKFTFESLKAYSDALSDFKMFTFWSVDYKRKITSASPRKKVNLLLFMHGCLLLEVDDCGTSRAMSKFSQLKDVQITRHLDPNVQFGFCIKFIPEDKLFLLESNSTEICDEIFETFDTFISAFKKLRFDLSKPVTELKLDTSQFVHHEKRTEFLQLSAPFLVDKTALASQFKCKLSLFNANENKWLSKSEVKLVYYANEESFPYMNFYLTQTGVMVHSLWLGKITKMTDNGQRGLYVNTDSEKIFLKFAVQDQLTQTTECIGKLSGNSDEKGIFTSRLASKFCANAYGNFQYKFCCYPVLLVDQGTGVLTINNANQIFIGEFGATPLWTCSVADLELVDSAQGYVSPRHVLLSNKLTQLLCCFCFKDFDYAVEFGKTFRHLREQQLLENTSNALFEKLLV